MFVLALFLLVGLLVTTLFGRLLLERRLALKPTPTLTRPPDSTVPPTEDFRATIIIADISTQAAYNAAQAGIATPTRDVTSTPTSTVAPADLQPTDTPGSNGSLNLPIIGGGSIPTETPTPTPGAITVTSPTPLPGEATQTAVAEATSTALSFTPTPTETPVPTATPTQTVAGAPPVATLQAIVKTNVEAKVFTGPSVLYSYITTLPANLTVRLEGRTSSGEWVRVCCVNNVDGWARQVFFNITGNKAPPGAPPTAAGDDVRWLALQQTNATPLTPLPTPTTIARASFPLFRRDSAGTARVDAQFYSSYRDSWQFSGQATASSGFSSAPVVIGSLVIAASADNHLYGFDQALGNQRFRLSLDTIVEFTPAIQDPYIYLVNQTGEIIAVRDTGNIGDAFAWRKSTNIAPSAPLNIYGNILYMAGSDGVLYAFNRLDNGSQRWTFPVTRQADLQYPTIGDQLVYAGDANLNALDVYTGTSIWQNTSVRGMASPAIYGWPGVKGLAEVYVADREGVVHALDANTGASYWSQGSADRPTALALDERTVYLSGPGFVSARDRGTGEQIWRTAFDSGTLGGPIVGNGRILVAGVSGSLLILDAAQGQMVGSIPVNVSLAGSPAVSNDEIFLAGRNGQLYKMTGAN